MGDRSYAIIGTGALGGFYGALLHHAGFDVHFLLHSDFEHVRAHGLRVVSERYGDLSIARPNAYGNAGDLPPCDVVAVCLKSTRNALLAELLPLAAGPTSWVLMMQNGLDVEAAAASALPGHTILGGLAFLCSNKLGPGHIHHLDYGPVRLAEHTADGTPAGITAPVAGVADDLRRARVSVEVEEDLITARWMKLVWNVTFNGLCVVRRCTTDVLMADPTMRARCEAIMREVVGAARACGRLVDDAFVDFMMTSTDKMISYKPSMLLDYETGAPLELEAIYAAPLRAARGAGAECPEIAALYEELLQIDARNRGTRGDGLD